MNDWYIDAIDTRAGLAIASRRAGNEIHLLNETGPIAYVAPPAFTPELIASRATALAMARGHAQIGLFDEDGEVPFDSLEAVVEFVRRVYLRGAGGDGPGGGPPTPPEPPPPEETGGEGIRPMRPDDREMPDPVAAIATFAQGLATKSAGLGRGRSATTLGTGLAPPPNEDGDRLLAARRIARGALRVLREVYRARPREPVVERDLDWYASCGKLLDVIDRCGIWALLRDEFRDSADAYRWFGVPSSRQWRFDDLVYQVFDGRPFEYGDWGRYSWVVTADTSELLERLPVPKELFHPAQPGDQPNLLAALSTAIADPKSYFPKNVPDRALARGEIVFFAAAALNMNFHHGYWWAGDIGRLAASRAAARAQIWLARNMPKRVFSPGVESLIGQATTVRA